MDLSEFLDLGFWISTKEINITNNTGVNKTHPMMNNCRSVIFWALY